MLTTYSESRYTGVCACASRSDSSDGPDCAKTARPVRRHNHRDRRQPAPPAAQQYPRDEDEQRVLPDEDQPRLVR